MGAMNIFDDGDAAEDINNIEVDQEFARRYEHNKNREALQRLEELKKTGRIGGDDDTESDSESLDDDDDNTGVVKLFDKLLKVKNRHPSLYRKVPFFSDSEEEEEGGERGEGDGEKKNKRKTMYLKDVVAKTLIEKGPEFDDAETSERKTGKTYNEEQEELRKQFLDAVKDAEGEDDGEGELLKVKDGSNGNIVDGEDDKELESKLEQYFGEEEELDEKELFLKKFFQNKMWIDKDNKDKKRLIEPELSEDEDAVEMQENYEAMFNFRHEENVGDRVMGHPRVVEGTVRKKDNPRKEQRKKKEERMKIAEMERKEELKHLKNLKKKEMEEKIQKVMKVAGIESADGLLDLNELEDEFDPQEHDRMMKKAFDDKYYEAEDADPKFGSDDDDDDDEDGDIQKPDFDKEDELLGLGKGWDSVDDVDDFLAARERILKQKSEMEIDGGKEEEGQEEGEQEEGKRKRKRKLSLVQNTKQELLDEYYKLDYEGTIGELKTRFKYAKVDPNKYGLKTEDIILLDEKDLNQLVSVKRLAPYRETEWKVAGNLIHEYKKKAREIKSNLKRKRVDKGKKEKEEEGNKGKGDNSKIEEEEESSTRGLSRKARRKLNHAPLKLSKSRLSAYGKTSQVGGKSKRKQ
ncbi:Protein KRI1 homolog [Linum perenne]